MLPESPESEGGNTGGMAGGSGSMGGGLGTTHEPVLQVTVMRSVSSESKSKRFTDDWGDVMSGNTKRRAATRA